MKITFLGTSASVPTKDRNHTAIVLSFKNENILLDCGENTQRQLTIAGISAPRITKILISHWHGDHVLGLPGLISTLASTGNLKPIEIYGPKGTKKYFNFMMKSFLDNHRLKIKVIEVNEGIFFKSEDFYLEAAKLKHPIPCLAFSFVEKDKRKVSKEYLKKVGLPSGPIIRNLQLGKNIKFKGKTIKAKDATYVKEGRKLTFISNAGLSPSCIKISKNADILICESTFADDLKDKAIEYEHLTARQAATIAKKAKAKKLFLTHFSPRYTDVSLMEKEAKSVFKNVVCAKDFMVFSLDDKH